MTPGSDTNLIKKLSRLNLNLMLVFYTLLREKHLTRASQILCLSQPAISHSLRKLRKLFSDELFIRTAEGMQPTPMALMIGTSIEQGLYYFDHAISLTREFEQETSDREFRIGLTDYMSEGVISYLTAYAARNAPDVCFSIVPIQTESAEETLDVIRSRDLDIAIAQLEFPPAGDDFDMLFEELLGCIGDSDIFGPDDRISIEDFVGCSHIVLSHRADRPTLMNKQFKTLGTKRKIVAKTPHLKPLSVILPGTRNISPIPERAARYVCAGTSLKFYKLPSEFAEITFNVCSLWDARKTNDPGVIWLRKLLRDATAVPPV